MVPPFAATPRAPTVKRRGCALAPKRDRAMPATSPSTPRNLILASLSSADLGLLLPNLEPVVLALRYVLEIPNKRVDAVYFPESGFASVVAGQAKQAEVEVGLVGREGMTGLTIVLGNHSSPHSTYMQVFMVQTAHTAIANARAKIDERLARWILMADDRLDGNSLPLTHEFLALMLGVRRAGVTEAIHVLEAEKLIQSARGQIVVLNR